MRGTYVCKLSKEGQILDDYGTCTLEIEEGAGYCILHLTKPLLLSVPDMIGRQFHLIIDPPVPVQGMGIIGEIPIFFEHYDSSLPATLEFKVGTIQ
jgi:hypothetical protein